MSFPFYFWFVAQKYNIDNIENTKNKLLNQPSYVFFPQVFFPFAILKNDKIYFQSTIHQKEIKISKSRQSQ